MTSGFDIGYIFKKKFISSDFKTLLNQVNREELGFCYILMKKKASKLKKADLINFYFDNYHLFIDDILLSFHSEILDFIYTLVDNNGEIEYISSKPHYALLMKMFLIAFPVVKNNKYKLIIASEVMDSLKKYDRKKLYNKVKTNDLVKQYTRGLLSLYGQFEVDLVFKYIKEYEGLEINIDDFYLLLNNDGMIYGFEYEDEIIYDFKILDIKDFNEAREKHTAMDYYHLTKKEILNEQFATNSVSDQFLNFLLIHLEMPLELAHKFLELATETINFNISFQELTSTFVTLDLSTFEKKQMEKILEKLYYNTRLWTLKGHTRNELKIPKLIKFEKK